MVIIAFAILVAVHGLIHLLGFVKALGLAELQQLTEPVSMAYGVLWLLAALLCLVTAGSVFLWPRGWWMVGAGALLASVVAIASSWSDARFGLVPNGILLVGVIVGFFSNGPSSLRAEYDEDRDGLLSAPVSNQIVIEADLAHLPPSVQRYLRRAGAVGQTRIYNFTVRLHGRIRSGPDARWMPLTAEQYNFVGPGARLFYLKASMLAIPVQGYHRYVGSAANMRVKAAGIIPVATAAGPEMTQSETVTLFNDMCLFAPATLIDPAITWEILDPRRVRARFAHAGHAIRAELSFGESGELTDFVSDDRYQVSGVALKRVRWSTPVTGYRTFGAAYLPSGGEGRWHESGGDYPYIELTVDKVEYNVRHP